MSAHRLSLSLLAVLLLRGGPAFAQAIEGKVTLPPAAAESIADQRYQTSSDAHAGPPDAPAAVVYLEGAFTRLESPTPHLLSEMAQKNISFLPGLLPIQVGTTVEFPNLDDTYHNVFSYSKTKRFDLGRYRKGERPGIIIFDKPGVVTLHCEIHGSMRGTILVLETPHFTKTDEHGAFRLESLPTGRYLLKAWISEDDVRAQPVELKAGTTLHVNFPAK